MGKFFTVEIKPTMPIATQIEDDKTDIVFGANDVVFDWMAFDVPKGGNRLIGVTLLYTGKNGVDYTPTDFELFWANLI